MARRRYNPNQKRDRNGKWTKGSLSGSRVGSSTTISRSSSTGNTRRYDAYLAKQAAQKQQARKTAIKRVVLGAAVLGAAGAGVYVGSRNGSSNARQSPANPVRNLRVESQGPKVPVVGRSTTPKKMETSAGSLRKVAAGPVVSKSTAGTRVTPSKPVAKSNPASAPIAAQVTSGVGTVKAERAMVSLKRTGSKPKPNPSGNPVPTPGALVTEDGKSVKVVKGLNDAERIRLENNALKAKRELAALEKKAGVNVGSQARRDFDKKNAEKRTKSQAQKDRAEAKRIKRREDMSKAIQQSMSVSNVIGSKMSTRDKAEARYATILENMMESGSPLNRKQRTFLKEYLG